MMLSLRREISRAARHGVARQLRQFIPYGLGDWRGLLVHGYDGAFEMGQVPNENGAICTAENLHLVGAVDSFVLNGVHI
jgi:hypothetical protein